MANATNAAKTQRRYQTNINTYGLLPKKYHLAITNQLRWV